MLKLKCERKPMKALVLNPEYNLESLRPRSSRSASNRESQDAQASVCTKEELEWSIWPYYWEPGKPYVEMRGYKLDCKGTLLHAPGNVLKGVQTEPHTFTILKLGDETQVTLNSNQSILLPLDRAAWQMKEQFYLWQLKDKQCTYSVPNLEKLYAWFLQMDNTSLSSGLVLPISEFYTSLTKTRPPTSNPVVPKTARKSKTSSRRSQKKTTSSEPEKHEFNSVSLIKDTSEKHHVTERLPIGKSRSAKAKDDDTFKIRSPTKSKSELVNEIVRTKIDEVTTNNRDLVGRKENSKTKKRRRSLPNVWSEEESVRLRELAIGGTDRQHWIEICKQINIEFGGRKTPSQCSQHYHRVVKLQTAKIIWKYLNESKLLESTKTLFPLKFEELFEKYKGVQTIGECLRKLSAILNVSVPELKNELRARIKEKSILSQLDDDEDDGDEDEDDEDDEEDEDDDSKRDIFFNFKDGSSSSSSGSVNAEEEYLRIGDELEHQESKDDYRQIEPTIAQNTEISGDVVQTFENESLPSLVDDECSELDADSAAAGSRLSSSSNEAFETLRKVSNLSLNAIQQQSSSNDNRRQSTEVKIGNNESQSDTKTNNKRSYSQVAGGSQSIKKKNGDNKRFNDAKQAPRLQLKSSNKRLTVILSHKKENTIKQEDE